MLVNGRTVEMASDGTLQVAEAVRQADGLNAAVAKLQTPLRKAWAVGPGPASALAPEGKPVPHAPCPGCADKAADMNRRLDAVNKEIEGIRRLLTNALVDIETLKFKPGYFVAGGR